MIDKFFVINIDIFYHFNLKLKMFEFLSNFLFFDLSLTFLLIIHILMHIN